MGDNLYNMLLKYVQDPSDASVNYALGREYEKIGHTAGAISYLLRAAERTEDRLLAYECLVRIANCFDRQGNRPNTTRDMYRAAIAWMPERPEAYHFIAKKQENDGQYSESYMYACLGHEMEIKQKDIKDLDIGFSPGWGLLFTKARSGWWLGKNNQSRRELQYLADHHYKNMDDYHQKLLEQKVIEFGSGPAEVVFRPYFKKDHDKLRYKFPGSEKIERNFSQVYQDMFILSILNGKRNGTFLEVGGCDPYWGNNTATLEHDFDWKGVSIELDEKYAESYRNSRPRVALYNQDAITTDYRSLLKNHFEDKVIDYLQMDIDPPINTFKCLHQIPFDEYKFRVITYEHDYSTDMTREIRKKSREFLRSKGYLLIVDDISPDGFWNFEDWWVHPDLVDPELLKKMMSVTGKTKSAEDYIFGKDINTLELTDTMETINDLKIKVVDIYEDYDQKVHWGWASLNKSGYFIDCVEEICTRVDNPVCVEIGVYAGKSLLPIAMSLQRNKKGIVYGIDPWSNEEAIKGYSGPNETYWGTIDLKEKYEFFQNLISKFDLSKYVVTVVDASDNVPEIKNIDLLHIDGQHTEQAVRDAKKFASQVTLNGYCFVDDITWGEVADLPYLLKDMGFVEVHRVDTGVMYKRVQVKELTDISAFTISKNFNKRSFIVDNFYADPMTIREFAQRQEYIQGGLGRGFIGRRTVKQFLFPGLKESFESIMQKKITAWDEHGMNGRFQLNIGGEQLVYHCDSQKYAAMIYLTPNAPPSCGTSTFMHKKSRVYHNSDPRINEVFAGVKTTMDGTIHERVDSFGNIFNRLVIFDAGCIHAASEYFGADMEDGRLWHMFFFDAE
jgi:uncharacterized protein YebE (UPF0316 family)